MKTFKEVYLMNKLKLKFKRVAKSHATMLRIYKIVKSGGINSERVKVLGKAYNSGNMIKLNNLITKYEKEDGIK